MGKLVNGYIEVSPTEFMTQSGRFVDVVAPTPGDVNVEDIAHHLSMICRFGGATPVHYSVAQHCVFVSKILEAEYPDDHVLQYAGLLHDASEAYVGDMVSPLKRRQEDFRAVEDKWMVAIGGALKVDPKLLEDPRVHRADDQAFGSEWRDILQRPPLKANILSPLHITPVPAVEARALFMARFYELKGLQLSERMRR